MSADLRVMASRLDVEDEAALAWRAIEPAWNAISIYDGSDKLAAGLAQLSSGQRALLATHWCISEVSNGGFDQFLTNPSGLLAAEALEALSRIGAVESERILRQAIEIFESRPSSSDVLDRRVDEAEHADEFDAYRARHAPLEDLFYALLDIELYPKAASYIRTHPTEFIV